ncbi:MAG: hypothetical protein NTX56_04520 [Proteobacteria bacterium]|nr:hypothetical protein [Pseudomonadota bacterium]
MGTITSAQCNSFKVELYEAVHNFTASTGDTYKIALIKPSPTGSYGAGTTNYSNLTGNSDEITGTGYTAGGVTLTDVTPTIDTNTAIVTFGSNPAWATATFSCAGALIYNSSKNNKAVAVFSLGGTHTVAGANFTLALPAATAATALIRYL